MTRSTKTACAVAAALLLAPLAYDRLAMTRWNGERIPVVAVTLDGRPVPANQVLYQGYWSEKVARSEVGDFADPALLAEWKRQAARPVGTGDLAMAVQASGTESGLRITDQCAFMRVLVINVVGPDGKDVWALHTLPEDPETKSTCALRSARPAMTMP